MNDLNHQCLRYQYFVLCSNLFFFEYFHLCNIQAEMKFMLTWEEKCENFFDLHKKENIF